MEIGVRERMKTPNYRWIVLVCCVMAVSVVSIDNTSFTPLLPSIKSDWGLTYTQGGLLTTAFFVGYSMGQIPWGYVVDRFGGRKVIFSSLAGLTAASLLFGAASGGANAIAWRFAAGLLGAGIFVPSTRVLSEWFPSRERGFAIGVFGVGINAGFLLAAALSPLIALGLGWRLSVSLLASFGFIAAACVAIWLKDAPAGETQKRVRSVAPTGILKDAAFLILGYDQFVRLGVTYALVAWVPTFMFETHGYDLIAAGISISLMHGVAIIANPVGGVVSDRMGRIPVVVSSLLAFVPCFYLFETVGHGVVLWGLIAALGWLVYFYLGSLFAMLPELYGTETAGRVAGYQNTFASAGAFVLPLVLGVLRDLTGSFTAGWTVLAVLCALGSLLTLMARSRLHRLADRPRM